MNWWEWRILTAPDKLRLSVDALDAVSFVRLYEAHLVLDALEEIQEFHRAQAAQGGK